MSAMKNLLMQLTESIERELDCDFEHAMTLVQDELEKGTPMVDVFDVILDAHTALESASRESQ